MHAIGEYDYSLRFFEHALQLNLLYFGRRNLKVALSYHLVARTLSCVGDFRGALNNEKETYLIYKKELGENHEKTKESSDCLRHLTNQAVVLQKKMNELVKGNMGTLIPPIQIQPPSINSVLEMLNIINGILLVHISAQDVENIKELHSLKTAAASAAAAAKSNQKSITDSEEVTSEKAEPEVDSETATSNTAPEIITASA